MASKRQSRKRRKAQRHGVAAPPPESPAPAPEQQQAAPRRVSKDGPPPAPWGSFPLSEIVVLIGILLLVGGFFVEPPRGGVMIGAGLVLGSLAGLELAVREHLAGYRSHTLLIAGAAGVAVLAGLFALTELNPGICAGASVVTFGGCAYLLAGSFRRRSGGSLFRFTR
jgi:hypothetical protein